MNEVSTRFRKTYFAIDVAVDAEYPRHSEREIPANIQVELTVGLNEAIGRGADRPELSVETHGDIPRISAARAHLDIKISVQC